jgi:hypothetical protein
LCPIPVQIDQENGISPQPQWGLAGKNITQMATGGQSVFQTRQDPQRRAKHIETQIDKGSYTSVALAENPAK